jgi:hypothetical protein
VRLGARAKILLPHPEHDSKITTGTSTQPVALLATARLLIACCMGGVRVVIQPQGRLAATSDDNSALDVPGKLSRAEGHSGIPRRRGGGAEESDLRRSFARVLPQQLPTDPARVHTHAHCRASISSDRTAADSSPTSTDTPVLIPTRSSAGDHRGPRHPFVNRMASPPL